MKKLFSLFAAFLFVGSMWATDATFSWGNSGTMGNNATGSQGQITLSGAQNSASGAPTVTSGTLRLYAHRSSGNGASATFTAASGYQITAFTVTSSNGGTILKYGIGNGDIDNGFTFTDNSATISDLTASSFTLKNCQNSGSSNTTIQISSVVVTYEATGSSCENSVTVSKVTPSHGDFTLSASGALPSCDAAIEVVVNPTPATHYHVLSVSAEEISTGNPSISGPNAQGKYTVTYAQDSKGSSAITVTFEEDTKYAVNWYANGSLVEEQQFYAGSNIVEHAAPAALASNYEDKMFVGWVETPLDAATDVPPTIADFSDMDAAEKTFYALYATATKTSDASLTKMVKGNTFTSGDKIVIVAADTEFGLYHENASASNWVKYWTFEGDDPVVSDLSDEKKILNVSTGSASGKWKIGNATYGYLSNSSSTNLTFNATGSDWTFADLGNGKFTLKSTQKLSCRNDLTSDNANLWRSADNNGTNTLYLYKYTPAVYSYSAYVTTVPKKSAPISWSAATASAYTIGKSYTLPTLSNEESLTVAYSSTNPAAATINAETGAITIVAYGTTTIKATYSEDVYKSTVAEYTLNVHIPAVLAIDGTATKTTYVKGDAFEYAGLAAIAMYSDTETSDVTDLATWTTDLTDNKVQVAGDVTVTAEWQGLSEDKVVAVTIESSTALDNTEAEVKAVKFIENDQLFIEKAGKTYNAQGQLVK